MSPGRWVVLLALASCSDPIITEDTARGCRNRYDDDGDGLVDCADPSCIASGVCEAGETACRNGADDDGDGRTDCQQTACVEGGYCDSAVATCAVAPQSGCLAGQGCYLAAMGASSETETRCRIAGARLGAACSRAAVADLMPREAHACPAGQACTSTGSNDGICTAYCNRDDDCPPGGTCQPSPALSGHPGTCTPTCSPTSGLGCPGDGFRCASYHEALALSFEQGGARFLCTPMGVPAGQATVGQPCEDPPTQSTPRSRVCGAGAACIALADGARCRSICDIAAASCPAGTTCRVLYATGRPAAFGTQRFGACAP